MGRRREQRQREEALAALLLRQREAGRSEGSTSRFVSILSRVARRLLRLDAQDAVRMIEERGPEQAIRSLGQLARDVFSPRWKEALSPVLEDLFDSSPVPTDKGPANLSFDLSNDRIRDAFEDYVVNLSGNISETTRENITKDVQDGLERGLSVPEIASRVRDHSDEISPPRANLIARTEAVAGANRAALIKAKESGVVSGKRWLATKDSRTRPEHAALDGVEVGIDEPFPNGLQHPGEPNCRCSTTFVVDMEAVNGRVA